MNRRSFLKFVGLAPVVPGLAVEALKPKVLGFIPTGFIPGGFSWEQVLVNYHIPLKCLATDMASFDNKPGWKEIIAEAFPKKDIRDHSLYPSFMTYCNRPRIGVKNDYSKLHTQQNQGIKSV